MRIRKKETVHMKASMTVEAVFVVSLVLLIILGIMNYAIVMYQETIETAVEEGVNTAHAADTYRKLSLAQELLQ